MPFRLDKWLVVAAVIALSSLSWWLPLEQRPAPVLVPQQEVGHVADFNLGDFELTAMNAQGKPRYRLQAPALVHYADDDTAQVAAPHLKVFRTEEAPPWELQARQASVAPGGKTVLLKDQVEARRLTDVPAERLALYTSVLWVIPDRQYAVTGAPVTIVSDRGETHGVGLEADFKQQRYELLARVRGKYENR